MNGQEKVFEKFASLGIEYEFMNHPAVFTIEDMEKLNIMQHGDVCKNLFLRDEKGKRHFLVVLGKDKKADLQSLQQQLNCTRLSFASEERLEKYLKLKKGEVSPLALINDPACAVEVVIDKDIVNKNRLGFHPNDNTATVWISFGDLRKFIERNGNSIHFVTI